MMKRLLRSSKSEEIQPFPSRLRKCIKRNAQELKNKVKCKPLEKFRAKENVLLKTIDLKTNNSKPIEFQNFLEEREVVGSFSKTCEHVCIIGSKGSGKTTVLARFIGEAYAGRIPQIEDGHVLHVLNCNRFDADEEITVLEFLFGDFGEELVTLGEKREGYEWMKNNPTKLTFVVDSLESLRYPIKEDNTVWHYDRATPGTILRNLIEGNLFISCAVLTTCEATKFEERVDGDDQLPVEKTILVSGLSPASINRIASKYLGEERFNKSFVYLKSVSPYLMTLCENPTILILTLASIKNCDDPEFLPKGISAVVIKILNRIIEKSKDVDSENLVITIEKLKFLAFHIKRKKTSNITSDQLQATGLTSNVLLSSWFVLDGIPLITEVESSSPGEKDLQFMHPVLIDVLFGLFIAELEWEKFTKFVENFFSSSRYSPIARYVGGCIMDEKLFEESLNCYAMNTVRLTQLRNDKDRKCTLLKGSLTSWLLELEDTFELDNQLNLFHTICECGREIKPIVYLNIDKIKLCRFGSWILNSADMCALATIISYRVELEQLTLTDCPVSPILLDTLQRCIRAINKFSKVQNFALNIEEGEKIATEEYIHSITGLLMYTSNNMDLRGWRLNNNGVLLLQKMLNDLQKYSLKIQTGPEKFIVTQSNWYDATQKEITPEGGSVSLHDFNFDFPKGSLTDKTKVQLEMTNSPPEYPDAYIIISSTVNVSINAELWKPLNISVNPWVCKDDNDDDVILEVLHLEEGNDSWAAVESMPFSDESDVEFQCQSFSKISLAIKILFGHKVIFPISGVFCVNKNIWCVWFYIDTKATRSEAMENLKQEGYKHLCSFNTVFAKFGDEIEVKSEILPPDEGFTFRFRHKLSFKLNIKLWKFRLPHLTYYLEHEGPVRKACTLKIGYDIMLNNAQADNGFGYFEHDVEATLDRSFSQPKKRIEDIINEIPTRFSAGKFKTFSLSKRGLSLDISEVDQIDNENQKINDKIRAMVMAWKAKNGNNATGEKLSRIIETYFDENPTADNTERLLLERTYDEVASHYGSFHEWIGFASSENGLNIPLQIKEKFIGNQENITRNQKLEMLRYWTESAGSSVSAKMLEEVMETYDQKSA
ncbi:uncharacterized protein LOC120332643 [Styela clava]